MDFVVACILLSVFHFFAFLLGAYFMRGVMKDAQEKARYDAMRDEYYRLADVKTPYDPKPYVPPMK